VVTLRVIRIDADQRRIGLSLRKVDSGAYKDLDLKQIDLEGVNLEGAEALVSQKNLQPVIYPPPGKPRKVNLQTRFLQKPGFSNSHACAPDRRCP